MKITNVDKLIESFEREGFYYSKDIIFNYFNSLITKPFVILTGISGSGKSKIAEIFAEIISNDGEKQYELIPVKPNWRDNKGLFGFHNLIDDSYYITPLVSLFLKALSKPESPFFLILDEMNIAKTEHYFADYLSLIESRRIKKIISKDGITTLGDVFNYAEGTSLSEAIILAAIDIGRLDEELDVKLYRENRFSELWQDKFFGGNNWTAQFRSELNQGDNRLAHRVFKGGEGKYRLKEKNNMQPGDLAIVERLENQYTNIGKIEEIIVQDNLVLHNSPICLGTGTNPKCDCIKCPYKMSEKYKCDRLYNEADETYLIPPEMPIPLNVFTIGTVNVDETTYMFSPKVLDRSNVIEFNEVDFSQLYELTDEMQDILSITNMSFKNADFYFAKGTTMPEVKITMPSKECVNRFLKTSENEYIDLIQIFAILKKYNMQFGYRVMNEISRYMCNVFDNTVYDKGSVVALDLQLLQKVLPKFYGAYDKLWRPLIEVLAACLKTKSDWISTIEMEDLEKELGAVLGKKLNSLEMTAEEAESIFKYPRTAVKILGMLTDLNSVGFATFIK